MNDTAFRIHPTAVPSGSGSSNLASFDAGYAGMPPLDISGRPLAFHERWPNWLVYLPLAFHWLCLACRYGSITLPTAANPLMAVGGLCGDSKRRLFEQVSPEAQSWFAATVPLTRTGDAAADFHRAGIAIAGANLTFPIVAKPDIGCRGAGVAFIADGDELDRYIRAFPSGETFLLQRFIPHEGEAGIYYFRHPGEPRGTVESLTLKYRPYVIGDGRSTLCELIGRNPRAARLSHFYAPRLKRVGDVVIEAGGRVHLTFTGNHACGAIFRNGNRHITAALIERIDRIARAIPEFYIGRFDVRFSTISELSRGEGFWILEVNGIGAEPTNIWDRDASVRNVALEFRRHAARLFSIGHANQQRGFKPSGTLEFLYNLVNEKRLVRRYPVLT